jgi:hypothetical protein
MDGLEKGQVFRRMDLGDRPETMIIRHSEFTAGSLCAAAQLLDPLRLFRIGRNTAIRHEVFRIMRPLALIIYRLHACSPRVSNAAPDKVRYWASETATKPMRS